MVTYGSRSGQFATLAGQDQTFIPDFIYSPHYNANDLTFIVETMDPKVMIANLQNTISGLGLDQGTANSLNSQLSAALGAMQRGNSNAACGSLGATQNYVNAKTGRKADAQSGGDDSGSSAEDSRESGVQVAFSFTVRLDAPDQPGPPAQPCRRVRNEFEQLTALDAAAARFRELVAHTGFEHRRVRTVSFIA